MTLDNELEDELAILMRSLRAAACRTFETPDAELDAALQPHWLEMIHELFVAAGTCPCQRGGERAGARCLLRFLDKLARKTAELPFFGLPDYVALVREARDQLFAEMAALSDARA